MNSSSRGSNSEGTRTASVPVQIVCPTWCEVSSAAHAARLWENEGRCLHRRTVSVADPVRKRIWEQPHGLCGPIELVLQVTTNPAGREVESADVLINGDESNIDQLLALGEEIAHLTRLYRETTNSLLLGNNGPRRAL